MRLESCTTTDNDCHGFVILDSSFLVDVQNGVESALEQARTIEASGSPRRVPHVVLYDLYVGVGKGPRDERNRARIEEVVQSLVLEPTTTSIVRRAGELEGSLQREDGGVGAVDAIVGATARSYGEPVVTDDVQHFERMDGVEVQTY